MIPTPKSHSSSRLVAIIQQHRLTGRSHYLCICIDFPYRNFPTGQPPVLLNRRGSGYDSSLLPYACLLDWLHFALDLAEVWYGLDRGCSEYLFLSSSLKSMYLCDVAWFVPTVRLTWGIIPPTPLSHLQILQHIYALFFMLLLFYLISWIRTSRLEIVDDSAVNRHA